MKLKFNRVFSITLMMVLSTFQTPVNSEAICKGLVESKCASNTACTWVNSYVTKNGTEVNGYCRVKAGYQSNTSTTNSKGADKAGDAG